MSSVLKPTRSSTLLLRPLLLRPSHTRLYQKEVHSNKGEEMFIPPSYPDDLEPPKLIYKKETKESIWDELQATMSETSVKADRGDIQFAPKKPAVKTDGAFAEREEPRIDEM
ncbi:uncharacterized protein BP01DRAFT_354921 [Aspergillus saccharolyticus JOP 1030-1]|uniref:Uncharacterized protein n=1 Tax=Aspergillus saccharolyticus JOP 1030-1 TaxID=1450539 RepID=A0A318ZHU5_9EURO|nr:hypothetical protein BP01DRAFT_354921 [Aspergillus saccharolyticus JOP 1030-1]PYH47136.1 hypothetical protein BP01DRAFT_354921 [Aspergillus saccharolyticus JOP 1030-1]